MMRFIALVFALSACAANPPQPTTPTDEAVAPARDAQSNFSLGTLYREEASKPTDEAPNEWSKMAIVGDDVYLDCMCQQSGHVSDRGFHCEQCTERPWLTARVVSKFVPSSDPNPAPALQDKLVAERATYQCLVRMGLGRVRKVPFTAPPGRFLIHHGLATRNQNGRPVIKDGGHLFVGVADQQGRLFFCPFRSDCDVSAGPNFDEDCLDFAECKEVCRDPQGEIIW